MIRKLNKKHLNLLKFNNIKRNFKTTVIKFNCKKDKNVGFFKREWLCIKERMDIKEKMSIKDILKIVLLILLFMSVVSMFYALSSISIQIFIEGVKNGDNLKIAVGCFGNCINLSVILLLLLL